ncbi:hypothetical protein IC614_08415 [Allosphingosinicella flava]|uniref:DUF4238 domain-containing protein n=1 Tax=Allosphingosinicella flava TaxID=2771430 RepID=A0A7T2GI84_9SPHN|nr:hypothetical protein [Sphingosinicella flava]QPQ54375.1 hypothetical protein IC614_08415 [Sphingosinicella flava]
MAGKRQHYVPRLLQRGFLATEDGERTWLHRAGGPARLVGIKDVGTEDWFYSRKGAPGELTLDDAITAFEQDLGKDVAILRTTPPGAAIDANLAARITVHLVMRTAHLRQTIEKGIDGITGEIESLFTDPSRLGAMMGIDSPMLASAVMDAIRSTAQDLVPAGFPAALSERLLAFFMRERGDELAAQAVATLTPMFPTLFKGLASRVRDSHNAIVAKPLDDHGWVNALTGFQWTIEAGTDLILPDAVALAREVGESFAPLLFTTAADAELTLLPVAHDRILVGRRDAATPVDLTTYNMQAAASCQGFFIAARAFNTEGLSAKIGSGPAKALADSIAEAVSEAETARLGLGSGDLPLAQPRMFAQETFCYRVTLHDFGDDVLAKEYGAILQTVVGALARDIPLHELDGVTIAADYHDALERLDRGDPDLSPVTSGALGYGIGVAKPVTVMRDGQRKSHLVLAAGIADAWTSEDASLRASSLHLLIKMLAGIAHGTRYSDVPAFTPDAMGRELHLAVAHAPNGYWSARQAAFADPGQGESYAQLVLDSLAYARSEVADARARMTDGSDVSEASQIALECVSAVLVHAADWLGHRDGLAPDQSFAGDDLAERLAPSGLDHWLALFGRDLAACYSEDGAIDLAVVTALSRHVERLFWSLGIYCWPEEENVRCVVSDRPLAPIVLPGIDMPALSSMDADAALSQADGTAPS